jgi:hypothetical protein
MNTSNEAPHYAVFSIFPVTSFLGQNIFLENIIPEC